MGIRDPQVVCVNGTVYVGGGYTVFSGSWRDAARLYSFRPGVDRTWRVMDTPTFWYALAELNTQLLLVGGCEYPSHETTNKIFTLRDGQFVETLPPMREKRSSPYAVGNGSILAVAGGLGTSLSILNSVEVLIDAVWVTAPSLPTVGHNMKSALCGDQWYLMHEDGRVFHTSLYSLLSSEGQSPWKIHPTSQNVYSAAAAFFSGHLLSIGGWKTFSSVVATRDIYAFSSISQSWEHVADLTVPLKNSSAIVLSTGELVVVGGVSRPLICSHQVLCATIKGLCKKYGIIYVFLMNVVPGTCINCALSHSLPQ